MAVPHRLFALHPLDKDDDSDSAGRTIPKVKIATPHICKLISYEIAATAACERVLFFQGMSKQPMLISAVGTLFERFVLCWLAFGSGYLHCTPAHGSDSLEIPACPGKDRTISFRSKTALKNMKVKQLPTCFLPESLTFPTINAIILTVDHLITVQVSVSNEHGAKTAGFEKVRESGIRNRDLAAGTKDRNWCHVFVTDGDIKAKSLRNQTLSGLPQDVSIYSAVFDVGQSYIGVKEIQAFDVSGSWLHVISAHLGMTRNWLPKIVWTSMKGNDWRGTLPQLRLAPGQVTKDGFGSWTLPEDGSDEPMIMKFLNYVWVDVPDPNLNLKGHMADKEEFKAKVKHRGLATLKLKLKVLIHGSITSIFLVSDTIYPHPSPHLV